MVINGPSLELIDGVADCVVIFGVVGVAAVLDLEGEEVGSGV